MLVKYNYDLDKIWEKVDWEHGDIYVIDMKSDESRVYISGVCFKGEHFDRDWEEQKACLRIYDKNGNYIMGFKEDSEDSSAAKRIELDSQGNLVVLIYYENGLAILEKFSHSGDSLWSKTIASNSLNVAMSSDLDDSIYIAYTVTDGEEAGSLVTIKYDQNGNAQWVRTKEGSYENPLLPSFIQISDDGEVFVIGTFFDLSEYHHDAMILKYDANGNEQWEIVHDVIENCYYKDKDEDDEEDSCGCGCS